MTPLSSINKHKLLSLLDFEIIALLEVARHTLDSWPMRMSVEVKSGMTEGKLEALRDTLEAAVEHALGGGADRPPMVGLGKSATESSVAS
jgi:hypothetical protein